MNLRCLLQRIRQYTSLLFFTGCVVLLVTHSCGAQIIIDYATPQVKLDNSLFLYEDKNNEHIPETIYNADSLFRPLAGPVLNIFRNQSTYWLKTTKFVNTTTEHLILHLDNALIDSFKIYKLNSELELLFEGGDCYPFSERQYQRPTFKINLELSPNEEANYLIWMRSAERLTVPLVVGTERSILSSQTRVELFLGLFFGIMLVNVLYNFSIFIIIRDRSYLFYVFYIGFFTLTQASFSGHTFQFILFNNPILYNLSPTIFAGLAGISAIFFARDFLRMPILAPRLNKGLNIFLIGYALAIMLSLTGIRHLAFSVVDFTGLSIAIYGFVFSVVMSLDGNRPARFFLIAWTIFLIGLILFILRNLGVLPHNFFSNHTLHIGSSIEAVLLSIALADRINLLKKDKEKSQLEALRLAKENEYIIREQNVVLEQKVKERTLDLEASNEQLKTTLRKLQQTQAQLVNAEKMASLGQLTAGIAHEINNPINFVSSNIAPLRNDIQDLLTIIDSYDTAWDSLSPENKAEILSIKKQLDFDYLKKELQILLNGLEEGASRTAEIVRSLRIFSRLDESELKLSNIHEGLDSTLMLLKSSINERTSIDCLYEADGIIECFPGKLNQVFMNILTNAIQAIESNHLTDNGHIQIQTSNYSNGIEIRISDNGPGIPDDTINKIFEPFFTTKDVGMGTGLGLSIVHSIIEMHNGTIQVKSDPDKGTTFIIRLLRRINTMKL